MGQSRTKPITGNQLMMARRIVGLDQAELARRLGVHVNTVKAMEASGDEPATARHATQFAARQLLETEGARFRVFVGYPTVIKGPNSAPRERCSPIAPPGLKVPGIAWPKRDSGGLVAYWKAPRRLVALNYSPPTRRIWPSTGTSTREPTAKEWKEVIAPACQRYQADAERWAIDRQRALAEAAAGVPISQRRRRRRSAAFGSSIGEALRPR